VSWTITYYDEALQDAILGLPKDLQARYIRITERMLIDGPDIGMPHTRAMSKGLFEIRLKGKDNIARVFYCTLKGRQIVMLHCFIKKTEKTPARELDQGYRKMREVLDAQS
jgi:phage-related protein